ncbi:hypothetical protein AGMMS50256_31870 [Betaproteobacteria bacterium]|nr:hypothetical protein AGMMS50256_31870 [Betaproteobacteria bacterium]
MNSHSNESRKGTIAVSLTNYLDSGCIVAGASGLTLWAQEFGLSDFAVGLLGAISANAFGSAIGALIGGNLADRFGRKFIYTYNMLLYMAGTILIIFAQNYFMLFAGFLVTGLSVGAGVPATWTYISETADAGQRAHNIGLSQFAWSLGPAIIFTLGVILSPLGLLGNRILFVTVFIDAFIAWKMQRKLRESADWQQEKERQALADKPTHPYRLLFSSRINIKATE